MSNTHILQLDSIHEMVERDMRIPSTESRKKRSHQTTKGDCWVATESTKEQVEPDNIRLLLPNRLQDAKHRQRIVERPATHDVEAVGLDVFLRKLVGQHRQIQKWIPLQFPRDVKTIFTQPTC